jgi:hypothetical protein
MGWNNVLRARPLVMTRRHKAQPRANGISFFTYCVTCLVGNDLGHQARQEPMVYLFYVLCDLPGEQ